jgi:ComEC/Rec2-related protein
VALIYGAGVIAAPWLSLPLAIWLAVGLLTLGISVLARERRNAFLVTAIFGIGALNLASRTAEISPADLRVLVGERPELVTLRGTLVGMPSERVYQSFGEEKRRTLVTLRVTQLQRRSETLTALGDVAATVPGTLDKRFFAGRTVQVIGVIAPPRGPYAEGLFDYRTFLRRQGIHYQLTTDSPADWQLIDAEKPPPLGVRFNVWARDAMQRGLPVEDEPLRLNWGMAMGWRTALTDEVSEPFMQTGTMHIFAISGLHIAFIAGILVALLRLLRVPRAVCSVIAIPLLWFYTAATGWQPSAVRSSAMMTVILGGWAMRRPADSLNSLGAAALVILVADPQQLFQASFQLSFSVVLSIILLLPAIERRRQQLFAPDPLLPPELRPRWQQRLDRPVRWVSLAFATSLAAWLGSLPLTAHYFHLLTPVSLLANLVVVPLSSLALAASLGSLLTVAWAPWLAETFNHAAWLLMHWMVALSEWFARWPGAFWHVRAPADWEFVLYYGLLIAVFSGWFARERRWVWAMPSGIALVLAAFAINIASENRRTELTVLPVNGGEVLWFNAPGAHDDLLIDVGNTNSFGFVTRPFLQAQGVNTIRQLALTHGDIRNLGAYDLAHETFRIGNVATSPLPSRSPIDRAIRAKLRTTPQRHQTLARGDALGRWRVLHPLASDKFAQADDAALVLLGECSGTRVLLLADLGSEGVRLLLEREPELRTDIVIAGLPTRDPPLPATLLARLQPQLLIVTDAPSPATQRATKELRARLRNLGTSVFFGSEDGAVKLAFTRHGWRASSTQSGREEIQERP